MDRVLEVEQKIAKRIGAGDPSEGKSWGERVAESEQYKAAKGKNASGKPEMDPVEVGSWHKTAILSNNVVRRGRHVPISSQAERAPFVGGRSASSSSATCSRSIRPSRR
jgi:hypothetical protein